MRGPALSAGQKFHVEGLAALKLPFTMSNLLQMPLQGHIHCRGPLIRPEWCSNLASMDSTAINMHMAHRTRMQIRVRIIHSRYSTCKLQM